MERYVVEVEPEVREWLESLSDHDYGRAEFYADLLADNAETLGEPYSRHLLGPVRELRSTWPGSGCASLTGWRRDGVWCC